MAKKLDGDENMRGGTFKWGRERERERESFLLNRIDPAADPAF